MHALLLRHNSNKAAIAEIFQVQISSIRLEWVALITPSGC
jgi:hypothetical protein